MKISELMLERYVAGAATADEKARIEASPEALERVAVMRRENDQLLAAHPAHVVAAKVSARAATGSRPRPFLWVAPLLAAACAGFCPRIGCMVFFSAPSHCRA